MKPANLINCLLLATLFFTFQNCDSTMKPSEKDDTYKKGSFAYDLNFLQKHYDDLLVLKSGEAQVIVSPALQGRVMTSTAAGPGGQSFGWLNHDYIAEGKMNDQFNPIGGEERFWVGPEGGQFSFYFDPDVEFSFDNWRVPKEIDTEPFSLTSSNAKEALFEKDMKLTNYSGTIFDFKVNRNVRLLENQKIEQLLGVTIPKEVKTVGFETENIVNNTGQNDWDKNSGMLSVWILSMLQCTPATTVVIPFQTGDAAELGKIVTDDYFGKVPADRLLVKDGVLFFKADGNKRSKIGLSPQRSLPVVGSYDAENGVLTLAQFSLPAGNTDYVNSMWAIQDKPFLGDAVNSYNDGPLKDGSQMGPFYELESSSPAAALGAGESLTHFHRTYHFRGKDEALDQIVQTLLKTNLEEIKSVWEK